MREQEKKLAELREKLKIDPATDACLELARLLLEQKETRAEAREVLFAGLARDPHLSIARLLLARSYYLDSYIEFSVRELVELQKYTDVPSLAKLLDSFGGYAMAFRPGKVGADTIKDNPPTSDQDEDVLAEIDIDDEFLDALDEIEGKKE